MDMLDNWQRIEQVIKWAGSASVSAFAREIGLNRGENLYQIKRGNNGISKELADIISLKYPQVSKAWLLTGEGEMILDETTMERTKIPFYETDVLTLITAEEMPKPVYNVSFPMFRNSDFGALSYTNAMTPEIPKGAALFFQEVTLNKITPGEMYLIVSERFSGIRFLRKDPSSDRVRLVPANKEMYDEIIVDLTEIVKLYLINGIVVKKTF